MNKKLKVSNIYSIVIIILASIIPIWNTGFEGIIIKADSGFPPDMNSYFQQGISTWANNLNFGSNVIHNMHFMRYKIMLYPFYMLNILGIPIELLSRLAFFIALFSLMFGSYIMLKEVLKVSNLLSILGSIFVIYNPYFVSMLLAAGNWSYLLIFSSIFYIFYFTHKFITSKKKSYFIPLLLLFFILSLNNYLIIITCFVSLFFYLILIKLKDGISWTYTIKIFFLLIFLFTLVNLWLIVPQIYSISQEKGISYYQNIDDLYSKNSLDKKIDTQMFFLGWEGQNLVLNKERVYNRFVRYTFLILLLLIIIALTFSKNVYLKFSFGIYLLFSFLAKGSGSFFSKFYILLYEKMPFFSFYRNSAHFLEFGLIFFVISLTLSFDYYFNNKRKVMKLVPIIMVLIILISSYPMFTGDLNGDLRSTNIPQEYFTMRDKIVNENGRILFPGTFKYAGVKYKWSPTETRDITDTIFFQPIISTSLEYSNIPMINKTEDIFNKVFVSSQSNINEVKDSLIENKIRFILIDFNLMDKHPLLPSGSIPDMNSFKSSLERFNFQSYTEGNLTLYEVYKENLSYLEFCNKSIEKNNIFMNIYKINLDLVENSECTLNYDYTFDSNWGVINHVTFEIIRPVKNNYNFNQWKINKGGSYYLAYIPDILLVISTIIEVILLIIFMLYIIYKSRKKSIEVY